MDALQFASSDGGLLLRAAFTALALQQHALQTGQYVDVTAIRQSAIQSARAEGPEQSMTTLISGMRANNFDPSRTPPSAELQEEIHQVRALMASGIHAGSSHARTPASAGPSIAERFFQVAELATLLASRLEFDKADLIVLSQVSKRVRACVLPLLVRSVNVRLAKTDALGVYFTNNPGLIEHVRYLRVWDDVAHYHANCGDPMSDYRHPRNPDEPKHNRDVWHLFDQLLKQFSARHTPPPLLELSIGHFELTRLKTQLQSNPRVVARLASLSIVSDFSKARKDGLEEGMRQRIFQSHAAMLAHDLEALFTLICTTQDQAGARIFHKFSLFAVPSPYEGIEEGGPPVLPLLGAATMSMIAERIDDLSLSTHDMYNDDAQPLASWLSANWPQLRKFHLHVNDFRAWANVPLVNNGVRTFLERHGELEHVTVRILEPDASDLRPEWHLVSLPNLKAFYLEFELHSAEAQQDFARRHAQIESLASYWEAAEVPYATEAATATALRHLQGDAGTIINFLEAGVQLRHVGIRHTRGGSQFEEVANSITCCEHFFTSNCTFITLPPSTWVSLLWLPNLPNLCELVLCFGEGVLDKELGTATEAITFLSQLLDILASHSPRLRALCVRWERAADLPTDDAIMASLTRVPPRLQYVTWHVPYNNRIQHYRIVRPLYLRSLAPPTQLYSTTSVDSEYVQAPPRFQRLPPSFRPFVNRSTGAWEDLSNLDTALTLFDHMGDEPRLKYL
ncbi:hypothetical protein OC844_000225 [Tilletia horrida]|nr:hypothetical protein OC844_000225 [Tilletia horrida]